MNRNEIERISKDAYLVIERLLDDDGWGEPSHAYVGDYVHYKLGVERIGRITEIKGEFAKVNGLWIHKHDLWNE